MKVLYLLDSLKRGGIEVLALDIFRNAAANNLPAIFVATGGGDLEKDFQAGETEYIRLERRLPIDLSIVFRLRKIISERRVDIVHGFQAVEGIHAFLAAGGTRAKVVLSHQGFVADKKNFYALRFLLPRVAANVFTSQGLKNWYKNELMLAAPEAKSKIIFNAADEKRLAGNGEIFRKELGISEDALLFGMIANFYRDPRKDQLTVCKALPRVFAEIPNSYCVFVGKTEPGAEYKFAECADFCRENGIAQKVYFPGARSDVPDILRALNLFVFSSLHEGLPIAALEAMLAEVPLVVSNIEPLLEVSENGKYAEVFPAQNAEILSEKIVMLLREKIRREDLAKRALEYAKKNFSIEAHIENLKKLYASIS